MARLSPSLDRRSVHRILQGSGALKLLSSAIRTILPAIAVCWVLIYVCGTVTGNAQTDPNETYPSTAQEALQNLYANATNDCWNAYGNQTHSMFAFILYEQCVEEAHFQFGVGGGANYAGPPPPPVGGYPGVVTGAPGALYQGVAQPRASSTTITPSLPGDVPALPFLGNWMVGVNFVPNSTVVANVTAVYGAGLRRQTDCTLDEDYVVPFATTPSAGYVTSFTGAQQYLRQLAGLTTHQGVFANGCGYQKLGLHASNSILLLGTTSSGATISAQLGNAGLYVTVSDSTANTIRSTLVTSGANPGAFYATDLRRNGIFDLVETGLTDPANTQPATAVLLGNGDGTFQKAVYYDVSANSSATAAGFTVDDVNGDGIPDIVVLNGTIGAYNGSVIPVTGTVTTLIGKGDGTFTMGPVSTLTWTDSLQVATGVFRTGDSKDLLVGGTVLFGSGNGSFTQGPTNIPLATLNVSAAAAGGNAVASLRNNGMADVVVSVPGTVSIFYGNGDGTFQTGPSYAGLPDYMPVTITDFDGDGNPDIFLGGSAAGVYTAAGYDMPIQMYQVLMGRGDGTFVDSIAYSQGTYGLSGNPPNTGQEIASADFNGDGNADVLVFNSSTAGGTNSLAMLPGDGKGALGTAVTTTVNNTPAFAVAAKMNGDTKFDAVVAGYGANNSGPELSVLTNQGNGSFASEKDYALVANPVSLAVGDFNGDGLADVAVGVSGRGVYVFFGQANGTLGTATQVDTSASPAGLVAGSLTTDGRSDLIVADQATGSLHVYLGNANETFTAKTAPVAGATNLSVAALGDLNNDGKLDLVVAGFTPGTNPNPNVANIYTFMGNGDGTFKSANTNTISDNDIGLTSLAIADLNKDGKLDVVAGNQSDYTEVLFGNGDGTLTESLLALAQRPTTLATADLVGNGYPEILVGQGNSAGQGNTLAVLLNQTTWTAAVTTTTTPTVTVTPSPANITTAQSTTVTVSVSGGSANPTPTGSVTLTSGTYASGATTLSNGSAVITVPGGSLAVATDTLTAAYTPDANSASVYSSATGTNTMVVTSAPTFALTNSGSISFTASATSGNTATVTVTPSNGFTGAVSLSCAMTTVPTGANSPATCSVPSSVTITGTSAQNATLTVNTTTTTSAGAYAVTVTGVSGALTKTTTINVTVSGYVAPAFTLTSGGPVTISSPGTTSGNTATITVTPSGGFTGQVALTASLASSPTGAVDPPTFSFGATSPVTISGAPASVTLTVSTTVATTAAIDPGNEPNQHGIPWKKTGGVALACILFFGVRTRRRLSVLSLLLLLALLTSSITSCGGGGKSGSGNPGTTLGNYSVTVTGSSGSISQSTSVNLTVN